MTSKPIAAAISTVSRLIRAAISARTDGDGNAHEFARLQRRTGVGNEVSKHDAYGHCQYYPEGQEPIEPAQAFERRDFIGRNSPLGFPHLDILRVTWQLRKCGVMAGGRRRDRASDAGLVKRTVLVGKLRGIGLMMHQVFMGMFLNMRV